MSYGFNVLNTSNRIQINQDLTTAKLLLETSTASTYLSINLNNLNISSYPLILIKPNNIGQWVGAVSYLSSSIELWADPGGFTCALFSPDGTPIVDSVNQGLEVYTQTGSIAYTSKHKHPQITHIHPKVPSWTSGPWTYQSAGWNNATYSITGYNTMPWIFANPVFLHYYGVGPYSEYVGAYMAKVNSGYTSVTYDLKSGATGTTVQRLPEGLPFIYQYDYYTYFGQTAYFGVGRYD